MKRQKLVLVGNGMAGVRSIEEILKISRNKFDITILGSEKHVNYNRILLSTVLQGDTSIDEITINNHEWYEENNIRLYTGETVVEINSENKLLKTDSGREVSFDKLIIATGSKPFVLPLPGNDKEGVITFRTIEDCKQMVEASKSYKKAVVIGGGLLGLEAARGLLNLGMEVSVVHISKYIMERQLDQTASKMLQAELELQGINFLLEKESKEIMGDHRVRGLLFKDGSIVDADLVVMAVGVRPNIQLAKKSGLAHNKAILVDDFMQTNIDGVYAVGECAEHCGRVYGLVKPLYEQGKVLATHISGIESEGYKGSILSTQLKVSGVNVFSAGSIHGDAQTKAVTVYNEIEGIYKKILFQDSQIIGAVLLGDTNDGDRLLDMIIKNKILTDHERNSLLYSVNEPNHSIAELAQSHIICNCNHVSKRNIVEAIRNEGLKTVNEVRGCTRASGSCGSCKPLVTQILSYVNSEDFNEDMKKKTLCTCTTLTEEEVVKEIQVRGLTSIPEVVEILNWSTKEGCSSCKPALSYYLSMIYPEYETEQETLFISERQNAFIQKDGTYTIIPQMYGGLTTGEQLKKIATVIEKYQVTEVAITSEQRIQLMGIKREILPLIWEALDMPLSSTHGSKVKTVKTCIGESNCLCDKENSLQLAIEIEKQIEFIRTPYQMKIGVSACIHNGAGATTKDIGIIGIDRGWEIYTGGSSGRNVREGKLLWVASTKGEAVEMICGFIQYYRETANYSERTWQWVERVGLIHIREVLFDQELRDLLRNRLLVDQDNGRNKEKIMESSF